MCWHVVRACCYELVCVVCYAHFTRCALSGKMHTFAAWVVKLVDTRDLKIEHREAKAPA